jgi:hypothetical protein
MYNEIHYTFMIGRKIANKILGVDDKKDANETSRANQENKNPEPEKLLFSWTAPARPFKRRDRDFWVTIVVITVVVGLILFFAEGFMPVILIISVIFLYYILSTVEPESIEYKITTRGIKMSESMNPWKNMNRFWFTKRFDDELLVLEAYVLGGRLELVIKHTDREKIKNLLSKYLLHEVAPPSYIDKATNWFSKNLPGMKQPLH